MAWTLDQTCGPNVELGMAHLGRKDQFSDFLFISRLPFKQKLNFHTLKGQNTDRPVAQAIFLESGAGGAWGKYTFVTL